MGYSENLRLNDGQRLLKEISKKQRTLLEALQVTMPRYTW